MSRTFKILAISSIALFVWICIAPFLAEYLIVEKPLAKADAILILGGSSVYVERTQKAALLYKKGVAPKILLTDDGEKAGWSQKEQRNPPFVDLARNELISQGVPAEAIDLVEPKESGTIYEAAATREIVQANHLKSILIVTSAYHTRRALWTFEKDFSDNSVEATIGIEPAMTGQQTPIPNTWWLAPRGWRAVAGEYVKILYYWLSY
jgi:uncharacterized SAM-binding protein YcdF (DUF218 family)